MISDKPQTNSHYDEIDDTQLVELEDIVSVPRVADGGSFQSRVTELTEAVDDAIDDFKSQRSSVDESNAPHCNTRACGSTFEVGMEEEEMEEVEKEEEEKEEERRREEGGKCGESIGDVERECKDNLWFSCPGVSWSPPQFCVQSTVEWTIGRWLGYWRERGTQ